MKKLLLGMTLLWATLSPAQARDWDEIIASGQLNVAMRPAAQVVYRPASEDKPGLMYEMVNDFAEYYKLQINLVEVHSFSDYWQQGNTDALPSGLGTPPLYDQIDIAAEIFTVTDRRKARVHLSPYMENVELLFARKGANIPDYTHLIGKTLITYEGMNFYGLLINEFRKRNLPYRETNITPVAEERGTFKLPVGYQKDPAKINLLTFPKGTKARATMSYQPVADGMADVGINDAVGLLYRIFEPGQFKGVLRPIFPAQAKRTQLAWGTHHEDETLNAKIQEFFDHDKKTGAFSARLEKYIGMNFEDYQNLIKLFKD